MRIITLKRERELNRGITLIALVITIIVLLILAGISIAMLTGDNGILNKAKTAEGETNKTSVEEKVKLMLSDYMAEKYIETRTLEEYLNEQKEKGILDKVTNNGDGTITVEVDGYTVTVNVKNQEIIKVEISSDIKFLYEVISKENNKFKVKIKVAEKKNGINTIKYPEGKTQAYNGQKEVQIEDYEIEEGKEYIFVITNMEGMEKTEVINLRKPTNIVAQVGYPVITITGAILPKVEIQYDESEDFYTYYSLDNGDTWNLYTEPISTSNTTIKVKSIHKKCQELFTEAELTIEKSANALGQEALDGDENTYWEHDTHISGGIGYCEFFVDETLYNKKLRFIYTNLYIAYGFRYSVVTFYNSSGEVIEENNVRGISLDPNQKFIDVVIVPEGTQKVKFGLDLGIRFYEVDTESQT